MAEFPWISIAADAAVLAAGDGGARLAQSDVDR